MPTNPSMLQARDAQLAADLMRFGGANQKELWLEFARHGFGRNATSTNTTANTDTDPTPDFEAIGTAPATVTFTARRLNQNVPVNARIFVGHYEARSSPIADTDPATTGPNLDNVARFAPGTYEFVATAPGYGHVRFREQIREGRNVTISLRFADNWASANAGAVATGDTSGADAAAQAAQLRNLIDDTENTTWTTAGNIDGAGNLSADGKKVTVDLAGTAAQRISHVQASVLLSNNVNRFTAVRQFEIWACDATDGDDCATDAGFSLAYTSPDDAFPGNPPRPVAPHMILRSFDIPNTRATHLRLVVKTTQCTGGPAFQGDQDADPAVNADCDSNVAVRAASVAELRPRGRAAGVQLELQGRLAARRPRTKEGANAAPSFTFRAQLQWRRDRCGPDRQSACDAGDARADGRRRARAPRRRADGRRRCSPSGHGTPPTSPQPWGAASSGSTSSAATARTTRS